jgi:hypothetical protein
MKFLKKGITLREMWGIVLGIIFGMFLMYCAALWIY